MQNKQLKKGGLLVLSPVSVHRRWEIQLFISLINRSFTYRFRSKRMNNSSTVYSRVKKEDIAFCLCSKDIFVQQ